MGKRCAVVVDEGVMHLYSHNNCSVREVGMTDREPASPVFSKLCIPSICFTATHPFFRVVGLGEMSMKWSVCETCCA